MPLTLAGFQFSGGATIEAYEFLDTRLFSLAASADAANWTDALAAYTAPLAQPDLSLADLTAINHVQPLAAATLAYWGTPHFGDTLVRDALAGNGSVPAASGSVGNGSIAGWDAASRAELATKSAAYNVVRQYIFHRLRDGIDTCNAAGAGAVDDWEIAYALHAGSLEGVDGKGAGQSTYALADKRCGQFTSCVSGVHNSNAAALEAWQSGVSSLRISDCFGALSAYEAILIHLTVPLVQGTLREAYEVDPLGGASTSDGLVEVAEGWAFVSAILPQVALCNTSAAQLVRTNMALSLDGADGAHVASGFRAVKAAVESTYPCLGITCADVGGMLNTAGEPIAGMEACVDPTVDVRSEVPFSIAVFTSVVTVFLAASLFFLCSRCGKVTIHQSGVAKLEDIESTRKSTRSAESESVEIEYA